MHNGRHSPPIDSFNMTGKGRFGLTNDCCIFKHRGLALVKDWVRPISCRESGKACKMTVRGGVYPLLFPLRESLE